MDSRNAGMMAGFGGLGAGLMGLMGGGSNPYKGASKLMGQIPGATKPYYQPYMNAGANALNQMNDQYSHLLANRSPLQDQYSQLMNDPSAMYNKIAGGYQQSPGFEWEMGQGMNAANNAAAAGGMAGSPEHQQQAATMATGLANKDFNNYMGKAMGLYGQGLEGSQGMYNQGLQGYEGLNKMGYGANDQMASIIADMLSQQSKFKMAGQLGQNQSQGQTWGNIFGGLGSLAAFL